MAELSVFFGESGARKTTAMGHAAEYLYEATGGKPGRAIYADGGGWKVIYGLVAAGLIQPFNVMAEENVYRVMAKLSQGYWPAKLDPETGLRILKGKVETAEDWLQPDLSKVGFYLWEGLTGTAELHMKFLRDNPNFKVGGDATGSMTFEDVLSSKTDGTGKKVMTVGGNNMMHWNWASQQVMDRVASFGTLPVKIVLITAHEADGTDDDKQPIKGPALVGKAATAKVARNVGDCIHFEKFYTKGVEVGAAIKPTVTEVRCYFEDHPDPKQPLVNYKCKTRVAEDQVPALKKVYSGGYFTPDGIANFLKLADELKLADKTSALARKAAIDARLAAGK